MAELHTACRCGKVVVITYEGACEKQLTCDSCSATIKAFVSDTEIKVYFIQAT